MYVSSPQSVFSSAILRTNQLNLKPAVLSILLFGKRRFVSEPRPCTGASQMAGAERQILASDDLCTIVSPAQCLR